MPKKEKQKSRRAETQTVASGASLATLRPSDAEWAEAERERALEAAKARVLEGRGSGGSSGDASGGGGGEEVIGASSCDNTKKNASSNLSASALVANGQRHSSEVNGRASDCNNYTHNHPNGAVVTRTTSGGGHSRAGGSGRRSSRSHHRLSLPQSCYERFYTPHLLLFFMSMTYFFAYFDHGAMTSLLTDVRTDPDIIGDPTQKTLSESKGGFIVSSFALGFLAGSPIFSAMGRYVNSRYLVMFGLSALFVGSFLTGVATSYSFLICARVLAGFGESAARGYLITMIDNIAPPRHRTLWIGVFMSMIPVGMAVGTAVSGTVASSDVSDFTSFFGQSNVASWRIVFFITSVLALPFALCLVAYPSRYSATHIGRRHNKNSDADATKAHHPPAAVTVGDGADAIVSSDDEAEDDDARIDEVATRASFAVEGTVAGGIGEDVYDETSADDSDDDVNDDRNTAINLNINSTGNNTTRAPLLANGAPVERTHSGTTRNVRTLFTTAKKKSFALDAGRDDATAGSSSATKDKKVKKSNTDHAKPLDAIKSLIRTPVYVLLVLAMGTYMLFTGGASVVTLPMLRVGPWRLSQAKASFMMGLLAAIPGFVGIIFGGFLLDKIGGSKGALGIFRCTRHLAIMGALGFPIALGVLYVYDVVPYALLLAFSSLCLISAMAPANAAMLSSVDVDVRTYAMGFAAMVERILAFPGATIVGMMADELSHGCHEHHTIEVCLSGHGNGTDNNDVINATRDGGSEEEEEAHAGGAWLYSSPFYIGNPRAGLLLLNRYSRRGVVGAVSYVADDNTTDTETSTDLTNATTTFTPLPTSTTTTSVTASTAAPPQSVVVASPECVWLAGNQGGNGHCMAQFEGRDAAFLYKMGVILPISLWIAAAIVAYKHLVKERKAEAERQAKAAAKAADISVTFPMVGGGGGAILFDGDVVRSSGLSSTTAISMPAAYATTATAAANTANHDGNSSPSAGYADTPTTNSSMAPIVLQSPLGMKHGMGQGGRSAMGSALTNNNDAEATANAIGSSTVSSEASLAKRTYSNIDDE